MSNFWLNASQRAGVPAQRPPSPPWREAALPPATAPAMITPQEDYCPSCESKNYHTQKGGGRSRCFDCGWPLQQQGSGMVSVGGNGGKPPKQAGQVPPAPFTMVPQQHLG